jgi:ribokinase
VVAEKSQEVIHLSCPQVNAVDTTGAGDCFLGTLATFLSLKKSVVDSAKSAVYAASLSVQKKGTQISFPSKSDLPQELFK